MIVNDPENTDSNLNFVGPRWIGNVWTLTNAANEHAIVSNH